MAAEKVPRVQHIGIAIHSARHRLSLPVELLRAYRLEGWAAPAVVRTESHLWLGFLLPRRKPSNGWTMPSARRPAADEARSLVVPPRHHVGQGRDCRQVGPGDRTAERGRSPDDSLDSRRQWDVTGPSTDLPTTPRPSRYALSESPVADRGSCMRPDRAVDRAASRSDPGAGVPGRARVPPAARPGAPGTAQKNFVRVRRCAMRVPEHRTTAGPGPGVRRAPACVLGDAAHVAIGMYLAAARQSREYSSGPHRTDNPSTCGGPATRSRAIDRHHEYYSGEY